MNGPLYSSGALVGPKDGIVCPKNQDNLLWYDFDGEFVTDDIGRYIIMGIKIFY